MTSVLLCAGISVKADFFEDFGTSTNWLRDGTNGWYAANGEPTVSAGLASSTDVFPGMSGSTVHYGYNGYYVKVLRVLSTEDITAIENGAIATLEVSVVMQDAATQIKRLGIKLELIIKIVGYKVSSSNIKINTNKVGKLVL